MDKAITLEQVVNLTNQLSLIDKVRLIEYIAPQIERELRAAQPGERASLHGLWKGVDVTEEDITEVRKEMWGGFPRDDV